MKPPFAYYGGKVGLARRLVDLMPPHRVYIEPFAGSLAVLFAKEPATHEIVNDIDDRLVTFFRVLRERPDELAEVCRLTPYARTEYEQAKRPGPSDLPELEVARRFWVLVNQSFAKNSGGTSGWSVTTARTQSPPGTVHNRIERMKACAARLHRVSIENCDAGDLVSRLATPDTVVYADPPYLKSTRVNRTERGVMTDYAHDQSSEADHRRFGEVLRSTPATVVLSGYSSPLYDELYGDWWYRDFEVTAFSSNAKTSQRGGRVERVWMNRDPLVSLFSEEMGLEVQS